MKKTYAVQARFRRFFRRVGGLRHYRQRLAGLFFLCALLFLLLLLPCYQYMRDITRASAFTYHQQVLDDAAQTLNTTLLTLNNAQDVLTQERGLDFTAESMNDLTLKKIQRRLNSLLLPLDLVKEAGLIQGDDIVMLQSMIFYRRPELRADQFFSREGMTTEEFARQFSAKIQVLPEMSFSSAEKGEYAAFTVAWRWSLQKKIWLFVTIPSHSLLEAMASPAVLQSGCLAVTYREQTVMARGAPLTAGQGETLTAAVPAAALTMTVQVPNAVIEQELSGMKNLAFIFFIIASVAGTVWVLLLSSAASRPFSKLLDSFRQSRHLNYGAESGSLQNLIAEVESLDIRFDQYENTIESQQAQLRGILLEKGIYQGLYQDEQRQAFEKAFPDFPRPFRLMLLQYADDDTRGGAQEALSQTRATLLLMPCLKKHFGEVLTHGIDATSVMVVLPDTTDIKKRVQALVPLAGQYRIALKYTLGESVDDLALLSSAWQQLEYDGGMLAQKSEANEALPVRFAQLQNIYMSLLSGDEAATMKHLQTISDLILRQTDFFTAKCTYQLLTNMLVFAMLESHCDTVGIRIPYFKEQDVQTLYQEALPACVRLLALRIRQNIQSESHLLETELVEYINGQLNNPSLCVSMVMEAFRISAPTLQKRLHAAVGQTFSAYIEQARMTKAREMLRTTRQTVQEVATRCGYTSANTFNKAYKRYYGETPKAGGEKGD